MFRKSIIITVFSIFLINYASKAQSFQSLIGEWPDPFVTYHDGYYYMTGTYYSARAVGMRRAKTLEGLRTAVPRELFGRSSNGGQPADYWAPEMFRVNGKWYIYYTADPTFNGGTDDQRMFVLENESEDPFEGNWVYKGRIFDPQHDVWAIDGTIFEQNGSLYYVYSGSDIDDNNPSKPQIIYIARMANPWTLATGRVLLSAPNAPWEGDEVNEGPEVIKHGSRIFIVYSTKGCWTPDYRLGMIYMDKNADPLDPSSWTKHSSPVFQRNDDINVYAPGHHCFFKSPDGTEDWFAYHATPNANGECNDNRTVRAQQLFWGEDGMPVFGQPVVQGEFQNAPSGEIETPVSSILANGIYEIKPKGANNLALDLGGCNLARATNIGVWNDLDNRCQRWWIHYAGDGYYNISSYQSGLPIEVENCSFDDGANIRTWSPNGADCQLWQLEEVEGGFYSIKSKRSGKVIYFLGNSPGSNIVQSTYNNNDNQKWSFTRVDDYAPVNGTYRITSKKSGLKLQLENCGLGNGVGLIQSNEQDTDCNAWNITSSGDGYYYITSKLNGKSLDVPSCNDIPAEKIQTWDVLNNDCQKFQIVPHGMDGAYKILTKTNGMSFDVAGCSSNPGSAILQYPYWGQDCQLWNLELLNITNVHKEIDLEKVAIYPNPTNNHFQISGIKNIRFVSVYTLQGELIKQCKSKLIDVSSISRGVYIIEIKTDNVSIRKPLIKE